MNTIEREIIERVGKLDVTQQQRVLDFLRDLEVPDANRALETYSALELMN